jgi:hypothetical protein
MQLPGRSKRQERQPASASTAPSSATGASGAPSAGPTESQVIDLERRRDVLKARVAELQWDLGGLVYEMAIRDRIRVDVLIKRAALLQDADSELGEVERILRLEHSATAGACPSWGGGHRTGESFCL